MTSRSTSAVGSRQAEAVAKRLAVHGLDKIYSSTSNRAIMTATPTCEILNKKPELLDFANENYAWQELTVEREDGYGITWLFQSKKMLNFLNDKEIRTVKTLIQHSLSIISIKIRIVYGWFQRVH